MATQTPAWQRRDHLFLVPPGGWVLIATLLLAVTLAGGRPLWAQGVITVGVGALWLLWPPQKMPLKPVIWLLLALALVPLAAYLPSAWLGQPDWRGTLNALPAIQTSPFTTPQPWFTFHVWLLWLAGVALAAWCAAGSWDHYHRDTLARMFTGGMVVVAGYSLFAHLTDNNPSWWVSTDDFGPFANRNQWGSLLGLCGVMALALIHQSVRHEHKRGVVFWSAALALFAWAVVLNGSRGGMVVLVAGGFAYWMFFGIARKEYRYAAIAVSFLCLSFALFAFGGGALLERFVGLRQAVEEGTLDSDMRVQFYRMSRNLIADSPWTGFGLGNFEYVFPFYLDFEPIFDRRPVHPESSWLWLASEGGLLAVAVMVVAVVTLLILGYRARRSRATTIRSAGLACALVMVVHAFFEVSGNRVGTLFPAIFLAALALPPALREVHPASVRQMLRVIGVALLMTGLTWIATAFGRPWWPAAQGTLALQEKAGREHSDGNLDAAIDALQQAARLKPLSHEIHWPLAAYLLEDNRPDEAWNEFRAANSVLPYLSWMIDTEGYFWVPTSPSRAVFAWVEALRRAPATRRAEMYAVYLRTSKQHPALERLLLQIYPDDPAFELARMRHAGAAGLNRLPRLLAKTDNLAHAPDHLVEPIFRYMTERGQIQELETLAAQNQRLRRLGWRVLAQQAARDGNFQPALDLHFQFGPRPALPAPISRSDLRSIERTAALAPMDIATAIAYYQALEAVRRRDDAFWQLRRIMEFPNAPAYIWYLAARTAHERGEYAEAWEFLRTYETKSRP